MVRILLAVSLASSAFSASAQPKPQMSQQQYQQVALGTVGINRCAEQQLLPVELAALGMRYLQTTLSGYSYSSDELRIAVQGVEQGPAPSSTHCNQIAMSIINERDRISRHNAAVKASEAEWAGLVRSTAPQKPVYCMRNGFMVACS